MGGKEPPGDLVPHCESMADVLAKVSHLFEEMDHELLQLQRAYEDDHVRVKNDAVDDLSHTLLELEGLVPDFTDHQRILVEEVRGSLTRLASDILGFDAHEALIDFEHRYTALKESFVLDF
ncbi:MAG: hypothetical protein AB7F31_02860 [Parachlamydiales bacterium]